MAVVDNSSSRPRKLGEDGKYDWSFCVCDCCSACGVCVYNKTNSINHLFTDHLGCWACWCPCVVYTKNKQRLQSLQTEGTPLRGEGETFNFDCWMFCCVLYWCPCLTPFVQVCWDGSELHMDPSHPNIQMEPRTQLRNYRNIRGNKFYDCCCSLWCSPCALTQERQEIMEVEKCHH
jgi:PLAC8 family